MARSDAATADEYLAELPEERRMALTPVRQAILDNLPEGIIEAMNWGMIAYEVPLETFPDTYNAKPLMYAALASQKNHMAVYLTTVYSDPDVATWFRDRYAQTGKKLDMGKSCVRFKKLDDLPVDLIGETIAKVDLDEFLARYRAARA
ncbi:MAG: DUF1801 domain-containing protein [Thermoleophilia bacterium]|nr:DUF1801 domain-containing protein [Thermoleophilia bacterium]